MPTRIFKPPDFGVVFAHPTGMHWNRIKDVSLQFLRGSAVGIVATLIDMAMLAMLVELIHIQPVFANVPALLAGACAQFLGCRHIVFRASTGDVPKQLLGFLITETGTLLLNGVLFYLIVSLTPIPYPMGRLLSSLLVFVGFSYPLWSRVFRQRAHSGSQCEQT